jgi:D-glycero-alpha-D-manno-heptose-7-phosphate kinase
MHSKSLSKTVRARAPLRLGLAGGGTDVSPFSNEFGGFVLNVTIGKYANVTITPRYDSLVELIAADRDAAAVSFGAAGHASMNLIRPP